MLLWIEFHRKVSTNNKSGDTEVSHTVEKVRIEHFSDADREVQKAMKDGRRSMIERSYLFELDPRDHKYRAHAAWQRVETAAKLIGTTENYDREVEDRVYLDPKCTRLVFCAPPSEGVLDTNWIQRWASRELLSNGAATALLIGWSGLIAAWERSPDGKSQIDLVAHSRGWKV